MQDYYVRLEKMKRALCAANRSKFESAEQVNGSFENINIPGEKNSGKYLKIKLDDVRFTINDAHPVKLGTILKRFFPGLQELHRVADGLVVKTKDMQQFDEVMSLQGYIMVPVHGTEMKVIFEEILSKNICKGIVYENSWKQMTETEILEELRLEGQNIKDVKNITIKDFEGTRKETNGFVVTFNEIELPEEVKMCGMTYRIRPFYPSPLICRKCLKVGHKQLQCRQKK